ncbi:hypothetical protein PV327_010066 [Microctonus hyperodae]|uniref:Uncharacterized protein n=1 Tax=Microctonus hyperodae TaxID=165561 RepID=A0AA39F2A8_MICHY|nr:hypothetical protein PV327_010066 [Microctonus hyperodae]
MGSVNDKGIPLISVIVDGVWAKRRYLSGGNSNAGPAVIIGYHLRIKNGRPYVDTEVDKVGCVNHLYRCLRKPLKKIQTILHLGKGAKQRRVTDRKDCISGSHENCAAYFCNGEMKGEERNLISSLRNIGLFDPLQDTRIAFTKHVKNLLGQKTSNIAESFFGFVCKTNNGKRTLVTQHGAYGAHIAVAVVTHNTGAVLSAYYTEIGLNVPHVALKMEAARLKKNEDNAKAVQKAQKRKFATDNIVSSQSSNKVLKMSFGAEDYGSRSQQSDLAPEDYEEQLLRHIAVLENATEDVETIEKQTREIVRATNMKPIQMNYLVKSKEQVLKDYEQLHKVQVRKCGIILAKKYPCLAASPEGIMADGTIMIIECPYAARNTTPTEAI